MPGYPSIDTCSSHLPPSHTSATTSAADANVASVRPSPFCPLFSPSATCDDPGAFHECSSSNHVVVQPSNHLQSESQFDSNVETATMSALQKALKNPKSTCSSIASAEHSNGLLTASQRNFYMSNYSMLSLEEEFYQTPNGELCSSPVHSLDPIEADNKENLLTSWSL